MSETAKAFVQARKSARLREPADARYLAAAQILKGLHDEAKRVGFVGAHTNFTHPSRVPPELVYVWLGCRHAQTTIAVYLLCRDGEIRIGTKPGISVGDLSKGPIWDDAVPVASVAWSEEACSWLGPEGESAWGPLAQELVGLLIAKLADS